MGFKTQSKRLDFRLEEALNNPITAKSKMKKLSTAASVLICLCFSQSGSHASAQNLAPSAPSKEYVYFGGLLVAVEERGGGTKAATMTASAETITSASGSTTPIASATAPPQPKLPGSNSQVSPLSASGAPIAPLATTTPPATHSAGTSQQ